MRDDAELLEKLNEAAPLAEERRALAVERRAQVERNHKGQLLMERHRAEVSEPLADVVAAAEPMDIPRDTVTTSRPIVLRKVEDHPDWGSGTVVAHLTGFVDVVDPGVTGQEDTTVGDRQAEPHLDTGLCVVYSFVPQGGDTTGEDTSGWQDYRFEDLHLDRPGRNWSDADVRSYERRVDEQVALVKDTLPFLVQKGTDPSLNPSMAPQFQQLAERRGIPLQ